MNCRLSLAVSTVSSFGRGRDADCSAPPAQTRVGAFNAHSSHLGCMASKRLLLRARGSQFHFRGLLRLHACYGLQSCSATRSDLCHKAPARSVARPDRLSATRLTDNYLGGTSTHK